MFKVRTTCTGSTSFTTTMSGVKEIITIGCRHTRSPCRQYTKVSLPRVGEIAGRETQEGCCCSLGEMPLPATHLEQSELD